MKDYGIFAALIYVTDTEEEAVMRMYDWKELKLDGDDQAYYEAKDFGKADQGAVPQYERAGNGRVRRCVRCRACNRAKTESHHCKERL